jgi:hypothetical protein
MFFFFQKIKKLLPLIKLSEEEKKYIIKSEKNIENKNNKEFVLFNSLHQDSFTLGLVFFLKKELSFKYNSIYFYYDCLFDHKKKSFLRNLINKIYLFLRYNKNRRLYTANGGKYLHPIKNIEDRKKIKIRVNKIIQNIKSSNDIINIRIDGIYFGDLIYDTYLRFFEKSTYSKNDLYYIKQIIFHLLVILSNAHFLLKNFKIKYFISKYYSYIFHGALVRFFLKNKIKVITGGYTGHQLILHKNSKDYYASNEWEKYNSDFSKIANKKKSIKLAKDEIEKIFGNNNKKKYFYMKKISNFKVIKLKNDFIGIIFLNCFFDAPHVSGNLLFTDFYDFIVSTLNFYRKNNFQNKILIKPHPNALPGNQEIINNLKKDYSDFVWISKFTNNLDLFKKKPIFGISTFGTVLWEMAYHNIIPIAAGRTPYKSYKFVLNPNTKCDYFDLLKDTISGRIKIKNKINKKEIYEWFFMHYLNNRSLLKNDDNKLRPILAENFIKFNFLSGNNEMKYTEIFNKIIL